MYNLFQQYVKHAYENAYEQDARGAFYLLISQEIRMMESTFSIGDGIDVF